MFPRLKSLIAHLDEQRLGILQVGGVEALGEPTIDVGEHRARLAAAILFGEQLAEASRRAQLQRFAALLPCGRNRPAETVLYRCHIWNSAYPLMSDYALSSSSKVLAC